MLKLKLPTTKNTLTHSIIVRSVIDLSKEIPRNQFPKESFFHTYENWLRSKKQESEVTQKLLIDDNSVFVAVCKLIKKTTRFR